MINDNLQSKFNPKNERIKYQYTLFLSKAKGRDNKTCMAILKHLREFEVLNDFKNFEILSEHLISNYINCLVEKGVGLSYIDHNLKAIKDFYSWLERQKGYKSKFNYNLLAYFRLTDNQRKEARAENYQESYGLEEIFATIKAMPFETILERRNRAFISLQALCGLRISELRTVKLKNLIFNKPSGNYMIYVSPKDMEVKFAKIRHAFFMPFPEEIKDIVIKWKAELEALGFKDKDPLFPIIPSQFNQINLLEPEVKKAEIKSNTTIIDIFKRAFQAQGLPYYRPHSFRHTISRYAETQSPQFFNAVSQSLGHSSITTTFQSYGNLTPAEIGRIIKAKNILNS